MSCGGKIPLEEGLEHPDLPDGSGEFLDAWLVLADKMVNPTSVMESPHTLPTKSPTGVYVAPAFQPLQYLIKVHKVSNLAALFATRIHEMNYVEHYTL